MFSLFFVAYRNGWKSMHKRGCASVFIHFCMQRKNNENIPIKLHVYKISLMNMSIALRIQILPTVRTGTGNASGGIQVELEEIQSRSEEYCMTRAFLTLLCNMTDIPVPAALGAGTRAPGFQPYLEFVMKEVFLKSSARAYKDPSERVLICHPFFHWSKGTLKLICLSVHQSFTKNSLGNIFWSIDGRAFIYGI